MHRLLMALMALSSAACTSLDDVRRQPIRWTATYLMPFDTLAGCIAARLSQFWATTPQIYPRQGIAYVTLADKTLPSIVAEFVVRRQSDDSSLVEWQRRPLFADLGSLEPRSREAADRCAAPEAVKGQPETAPNAVKRRQPEWLPDTSPYRN
jgi:hypothetical protein